MRPARLPATPAQARRWSTRADHLVPEDVDARDLGGQFLLPDGDHVAAVPRPDEVGQPGRRATTSMSEDDPDSR
ncbi:MAG: hypothetical protein MZV64_09380 [Ignavibacteriales bacterium]|nr:hypothetical protein [Ignavibacteriales bacterium]